VIILTRSTAARSSIYRAGRVRLLVAAAMALALGYTAQTGPVGHTAAPLAGGPAVAAPVAAVSVPAGASLVATATRSVVRAVNPTGTRTWSLRNPNSLGAPLVFLVIGQRSGGWLVRIPARPNGSTGWIRASDVSVAITEYSLRISLTHHRLRVYRLGVLKRTITVGLGRPSAPTPRGKFYLTEVLKADNPTGAFGPYAYGVSAFSSTFTEFEGGPGQIGMHGTNEPSSIGRNVSHGCIRMSVTNISWLAHRVPAGTPLTITL
jgi:lipoprotein-anchoring transpeptidase ErfK/SrfK